MIERHDAEELAKVELLLRQFSEQIEELFWLADAPEGTIRYVSPAYERIWQRTPEEVIGAPSIWQDTIHPDDRGGMKGITEAALSEDGPRRYRIVRADGSVRWIQEKVFAIYDGQGMMRQIAGIARDITAHLSDQQRLEPLVKERTRELRALLDGSVRLTSTFEPDAMPDLILEQLASVVEYSSAAIYAVEHDDLHLLASRGLERSPEFVKMSRLKNQPALDALAGNEKPLVIPDLQRDTTFVRAVRDAFGQQVRSSGAWIGVPLVTPSTVGLLVAEHFQPGYFSAEKADLVVAFADQAAGAIESARLYEQARQRVAEAESLRRVTLALVQKHTLEELLAVICREACGLIGAAASVIFLKEEENRLRLAYRDTLLKELSDTIPMATTHTGRAIQRGQALVVNERDEYLSHTTHIDPSIETLLVIPLRVEQEIIGALDMINKPHGFTDDDVRTINHFADAAALAIERARLQRQAEQLAVMRERQRLARELHDSVTQALYSLSLHTRAIQMALRAGDDASAMESIEEMRDVAREATLGMRRLIFELRPPALEKEGLVNALKMRLAAVEARAGLQTEMKAGDDLELPYAVEEELYWIASEALNNIVKHARAERVTITLTLEDDELVRLSVEDDGIGVDPEKVDVGGGIGFRGMVERAEKIQGKLHVDSLPHGGTRVTVTAGLRQRRSEQ